MRVEPWAGALQGVAIVLAISAGGVWRAQSEPASAPIASDLEAAAAHFVVERFLNGSNDLSAIRSFYGDSVFYFDQGVQSRSEVMADKRAYVERWPNRRFEPDLTTLETRLIPGADGAEGVEVRLEVDFIVSSAARSANGRSRVVLVLKERGDAFIVLSEGGRVVSRR